MRPRRRAERGGRPGRRLRQPAAERPRAPRTGATRPTAPDSRSRRPGERSATSRSGRATWMTPPAAASGTWRASARTPARPSEHSATAAYIGELDSGPTRTSVPILNDAGVAQVSPGATAIDLTGPAPGFEDAPDLYRPPATSPSSASSRTTRWSRPRGGGARRAGRGGAGPAIAAGARAGVPRALPGGVRPRAGSRRRLRLRGDGGRARGDRPPRRRRGAAASVRDALVKVERLDESVLGPYSFTTDGDTTLCEVQRLQGARKRHDAQPLRSRLPGELT